MKKKNVDKTLTLSVVCSPELHHNLGERCIITLTGFLQPSKANTVTEWNNETVTEGNCETEDGCSEEDEMTERKELEETARE